MADVYIIKGSRDIKELVDEGSVIDIVRTPQIVQLQATGVFNSKDRIKVIDFTILPDPNFIKEAICKTRFPLIVIFPLGKIPPQISRTKFKTKNTITRLEGQISDEGMNVFQLSKMVISSRDRKAVYEALMTAKYDPKMVIKMLLSACERLTPHNKRIIIQADSTSLYQDNNRYIILMAYAIQPQSDIKGLSYKFKKVGK